MTTDLGDPAGVPYFLWDDPMTLGELRRRLREAPEPERILLLARILREARDTEAWRFTSPQEVVRLWPRLSLHLGRRRAFWEFLLGRWKDQGFVVVDLVVERAPQLVADKPIVGAIRVDPPEEILANKLCALLGRAEIRDLVDVRALEESGLSLEPALEAGRQKDGGLTPAQLAWVLSQISIGDEARIPGGGAAADLRRYLHHLIDRLVALARP
jgi:hypothetical protein